MRAIPLVLAAVLASLFSLAAQGGQITQSEQMSGLACHGPVCSSAFSFQQFDPSMGELRSVTLDITGVETYFVALALDPGTPSDPTIGPQAYWQFNTGFAYCAAGFRNACAAGAFPIGLGSPQFAHSGWSGSAGSVDPSELAKDNPFDFGAKADNLAAYLGDGQVVVYFGRIEDTTNSADVCLDRGIRPSCGEGLRVSVELTFDYVPEPSSLILMAAGLALLLLGNLRGSELRGDPTVARDIALPVLCDWL